MNWVIRETKNVEEVLEIYSELFNERLSLFEFGKRTESYTTYMFIIGTDEIPNAGFSILLCKGNTVELWQMGILSEYRSKGAGKTLLLHCENKMAGMGFSQMLVESFNRWNNMLVLLLKNRYRITNTSYSQRWEDLRITLTKELVQHKELRYALTEVCNFKCLFCHNEGLGFSDREKVSDKQALKTLVEAVSIGYTDITLTGGEPLLRKDLLHFLLVNLGKISTPPKITLVTNGSLLDADVIQWLKQYPGSKKIHLSLHAANERTFRKLTQITKSGIFQKVIDNITNAAKAGLIVKVNHVVLKDYNHNTVIDFIELVKKMNASTVKFIELLVLPNHSNDYDMFFNIDSICPQIEEVATFYDQPNVRQRIYHHKNDTQFRIEVQRCTCAIGCSHCREVRDHTISSDLQFYPCFVRGDRGYSLKRTGNLESVFLDGERIIDGYAKKYGDSSPTLIVGKEIMAPTKIEFYFNIPNPELFIDYLQAHSFALTKKKSFHEEHFQPKIASDAWLTSRKKLKFGWYHYTPDRISLIYTDHKYIKHPKLGLETHSTFLNSKGPVEFSDVDELRTLLNKMEFEMHFEIDWSVEQWDRSDISVNLALMGDKSTIRIAGDAQTARKYLKLFQDYDGIVEPLKIPLTQFMKESNDNRGK